MTYARAAAVGATLLTLATGCGTTTAGPGPTPKPDAHYVSPTESIDLNPARPIAVTYLGPIKAHQVVSRGSETWAPPLPSQLPTPTDWRSVWRHVCPPNGASDAIRGATCAQGSTATITLARVTLLTQLRDKLMYVVTWEQSNCVSLGGPRTLHRASPSPDPTKPHDCRIRSYIDAKTGHDEYDEDAPA